MPNITMYQSTHVLCFINVFFLLLSFSFLVLIWNFFDIYYLNVGVLIVIIQTSIHRYWPLLGFWRLVMKILLGGIFFKQKFLSCKKKLHFLCETFLTVWHLKIQLTIRVIFFFFFIFHWGVMLVLLYLGSGFIIIIRPLCPN